MKKEFYNELINKWNDRNYEEQLIYFKEIQVLLLLENQPFNTTISVILNGVASKNAKLGVLILNLINVSDKYAVLRTYLATMLTGIGKSSVDIKRQICADLLEEGQIESIRSISLSYAWSNHHSYSLEDKDLINRLILVKDNQVDNHLFNILRNYQSLDESWVESAILLLSKRCDVKGFHELLSLMCSKYGREIYNFYLTNINIYKEILLETVRIADYSEFSHELANCLEYIAKDDPEFFTEYFISRINCKLNSKNYSYRVSPRYTQQFQFVNELDNIVIFRKLMEVARDKEDIDEFRFQIVELIYDLVGSNVELLNLFNTLLNEDSNWVSLIMDIMGKLPVTELWLDVVESILEVEFDYTKLNELNHAFYSSGGWTSEIMGEYNFNLALIGKRKQDTSSIEMKSFLNKAEEIVLYMINNEIEREQERESEFI